MKDKKKKQKKKNKQQQEFTSYAVAPVIAHQETPGTIQPQPELQPPNMETHAHHLHKAPGQGWRHYLFEFLMLFLAITLGFYVENLRESSVEHQREKQYVQSLMQDLVSDTILLGTWINAYYSRSNDFDTLIYLLKSPDQMNRGADMYVLARSATRASSFEANNNTIEQLKFSGNFRLIRNTRVTEKTISYQNTIENYKHLNEIDTREAQMLHPLLGNLFDATIFNSMIRTTADTSQNISEDLSTGRRRDIEKPAGNPQLVNKNSVLINSLIYQLHQRKSTFLAEAWLLSAQKKQAKELVDLIKEEYLLE